MASEKQVCSPPQNKNGEFIRLQYVVDYQVQGALIARLGLYVGCFAAYFASISLFTVTMEEPQITFMDIMFRFADEAIYALPAVLLICPLAVYDMMRLSNRFAGPALVLRRELTNLIDRKPGKPASFRTGDYWQPMADQFNQVREELLELRVQNEQLTEKLNEAKAAAVRQTVASETIADFQAAADATRNISQKSSLDIAPAIATMPGSLDQVQASSPDESPSEPIQQNPSQIANDIEPPQNDAVERPTTNNDVIDADEPVAENLETVSPQTADKPTAQTTDSATAQPAAGLSLDAADPEQLLADEIDSTPTKTVVADAAVAAPQAQPIAQQDVDPDQLLAEISAIPVAPADPVPQPETIGASDNPFAM